MKPISASLNTNVSVPAQAKTAAVAVNSTPSLHPADYYDPRNRGLENEPNLRQFALRFFAGVLTGWIQGPVRFLVLAVASRRMQADAATRALLAHWPVCEHDYLKRSIARWIPACRMLKKLRDGLVREGQRPEILEVGDRSYLTEGMESFLGQPIHNTDGDLRRIDFPVARYDLIFCWEVLEHIADLEYGLNELSDYASARQVVTRLRASLKPGGVLFVTVPNCTSTMALQRLMSGRFPAVYVRHHKEFTPCILRNLLEAEGFVLDYSASWHTGGARLSLLPAFLVHYSFDPSPAMKGDTLIAVTRPI